MKQIALSLPKLELLRTEVRALGPDTWRIRFAVGNSGWLPAYVTQAGAGAQDRARRDLRDPPAAGPADGRRWSAASRASKARSSKATRRRRRCRPSCPTARSPATGRVAEWVVRAPKGTRLALTARADRAGVVRTEVVLD